MAEPTSKKATMDNAVKGMSMKQLTAKIADPKTPAPIKAAAKRRLDRLSGADKTAPLTQMSRGGNPKKKIPVIAISVGMADAPKDKKGPMKMAMGGMANGKQHMYLNQGGSVKDLNPGLRALQKERPDVVAKILGK